MRTTVMVEQRKQHLGAALSATVEPQKREHPSGIAGVLAARLHPCEHRTDRYVARTGLFVGGINEQRRQNRNVRFVTPRHRNERQKTATRACFRRPAVDRSKKPNLRVGEVAKRGQRRHKHMGVALRPLC